MREFMDHVLQSFQDATGWYRDNGYADLNQTPNELLNFYIPGGLRLTLASLATPQFATSYTLGSLGSVDGSISYLYSSLPLHNVIAQSATIPLPTLLRSYRQIRELPEQAVSQKTWNAAAAGSLTHGAFGDEVLKQVRGFVARPTLLYGRLYLPQSRLEALVVKRLSPAVQLQLRAVSEAELRNGGTVLGLVQYDRGGFAIESLASTDGGLLGLRGLYNFGGDASPVSPTAPGPRSFADQTGVGLGVERERIYGRFSAGGEVYYGTLNKSAGMSLGARFATLPAHRGTPLTATLTINPLMGSISASYAVMAREYCSLATKFDFNVFSYESDWSVGMELWSKRRLAGLVGEDLGQVEGLADEPPRKKERSFQAKMEWRLDDPEPVRVPEKTDTGRGTTPSDPDNEYHGVLKARLDQNMKIGLLWEGRVKSLLFSVGTGIDLRRLDQPFKPLGLEIQFSS
ncbi:uncharacterized protein E0L32_006496 [Thyridium curvatum]|uniref:Mitochondrial distribution and morphology protein 10 n=1 Tax=Thyridium curvatum TaxID=1093900 RepID=A0A507B8U5_9PEZI|nr:uncharacterized protein E0L32_006496 [Thyridium curvatum]TPX13070.1 hypothetical protein E0L32_006496 [Thyridium curvatum]